MENQIPMMSPTICKITEALSKFQGQVKQPSFNRKVRVNNTYNFEYADLGACVAAAAPVLQANDLAITQIICGGFLVTTLLHKSGEFITSTMPYDLSRFTKMQDLGSALTYAKRYSYCAILGIVADADDDANTADGNQAQFQQRGAQQTKPQPQATATGADVKKAIDALKNCIEPQEVLDRYHELNASNPEIAAHQMYKQALQETFVKLTLDAICLIDTIGGLDEYEGMLKGVWPSLIAPKTTLGNAIAARRKEIGA